MSPSSRVGWIAALATLLVAWCSFAAGWGIRGEYDNAVQEEAR